MNWVVTCVSVYCRSASRFNCIGVNCTGVNGLHTAKSMLFLHVSTSTPHLQKRF